jgi:hypothetical protein
MWWWKKKSFATALGGILTGGIYMKLITSGTQSLQKNDLWISTSKMGNTKSSSTAPIEACVESKDPGKEDAVITSMLHLPAFSSLFGREIATGEAGVTARSELAASATPRAVLT